MDNVALFVVVSEKKFVCGHKSPVWIQFLVKGFHEIRKHVLCNFSFRVREGGRQ